MTQIANAKERNQAFAKYIIWFIATVTVIVVSIYIDMRLPLDVNRRLKDELLLKNTEITRQQEFVNKSADTKALIDSLIAPGIEPSNLEPEIEIQMKELYQLQYSSNKVFQTQNLSFTRMLIQLREARKSQVELKKIQEKLDATQKTLDDLRDRNGLALQQVGS